MLQTTLALVFLLMLFEKAHDHELIYLSGVLTWRHSVSRASPDANLALNEQLSPVVKKVGLSVLNYLKYKLFPYVSFEVRPLLKVPVQEYVLTLNKSQVNPHVTVANGEVLLPGEKVYLKNLKVSPYSTPNLLLSVKDRLLYALYKEHPYRKYDYIEALAAFLPYAS